MPAAELTQKVGYCMITSMSTVCYIEKNNLPGTAGNGKKTALREAIIKKHQYPDNFSKHFHGT